MKTPKEKAKELVYKYQYLVNTWDCYNDESIEMIYRLPDMKQCALISVDEILNNVMLWWELPCKDPYFITQKTYWKEVKQEIEKL